MELLRTSQKGFSLIEIMVAIAIIGIVMAAVIPVYNTARKRSKVQTTKTALKSIKSQLESYNDDMGEFPATLKDLIVRPADEKASENWQGPYLESKTKDTPKDSFNNPFQYERTPGAEHEYELYSYGPDGKGSKSGRINVWNS
jgi:general secretion pathway protein G